MATTFLIYLLGIEWTKLDTKSHQLHTGLFAATSFSSAFSISQTNRTPALYMGLRDARR